MYTPLEFTNAELQWGPGAVSETVGRQRMCAGYNQLSSPISPLYLPYISQHLPCISQHLPLSPRSGARATTSPLGRARARAAARRLQARGKGRGRGRGRGRVKVGKRPDSPRCLGLRL